MKKSNKIVLTAMCIALCVILPQAFHTIPNAGSIFLPMHIPVFLCGLICGPFYGMFCGIMGPFFSALFTGMPPFAILPGMLVECAAYGLFSGVLLLYLRTKNMYADIYISLISSMLAGRLLSGIAKALLFSKGSFAFSAWITASFITGIPGIIIQLILIPSIVFTLTKAGKIPVRYTK